MKKEGSEEVKKISQSGLIVTILLVLFAGVSFYIRTYLPHDQVFDGDTIKFTSVDAYFHMRLVDNLAQNFPVLINFDSRARSPEQQ